MSTVIRTLAVFLVLTLISCQKEIDWGTGSVGTGTVLYRARSVSGTDTTVVDYTYDGTGRLIREKTTGFSSGVSVDNDLVIYRNSAGVITRTVQRSPAFSVLGVDSVITTVYYNTVASRYTAASFSLNLLGFSVTDSAVFSYDGTGRINRDEHYLSSGTLGIPIPAILMLRNNYTYDATGSNLLLVTQNAAANPGDPLVPVSTQAYTSDAAVNPLRLQNEAIVIGRPALFNAANVASLNFTDLTDPANNFSDSNVYFYNRSNRPDSCNSTTTPGSTVTRIAYFYR